MANRIKPPTLGLLAEHRHLVRVPAQGTGGPIVPRVPPGISVTIICNLLPTEHSHSVQSSAIVAVPNKAALAANHAEFQGARCPFACAPFGPHAIGQGVTFSVAIERRIRKSSNSQSVENQQNNAVDHGAHDSTR